MSPQDAGQQMLRFDMGQRLGECLVRGCVALTGTIRALGPMEREPGETDARRAMMTRSVELKVQGWLHGKAATASHAELVRLVQATEPEVGKTASGPWLAWEGTRMDPGTELLVLRWAGNAPRPSWRGTPEDLALVVSDKPAMQALREAIAQHQRLEREPQAFATIPQLLHDRPDALLTGYVLTYLMEGEGARNVDRAAAMLALLIAHPALPGPARSRVGDWLASSFYRLDKPTRRSVTEALVAAASGEQPALAHEGLRVLVRLADLKLVDIQPSLTPVRQRRMAEHYRAWRALGSGAPAAPEFEAQLGLR